MDYNKIISILNINPQVNIVNYFTLKKNRNSWGPRKIPDFEMIYIREGLFEYNEYEETNTSFPHKDRSKGQLQILLEPGDILLIPPEVLHTLKSIYGSGAISCIHSLPLESIPWGNGNIGLSPSPLYKTSFANQKNLIDSLFYKCNEIFTGYDKYRQKLLSTICNEIWLYCASIWDTQLYEPTISNRMIKMLDYIKKNCTRDIGRKELAAKFNLTPEYINALFKQEMGMSPIKCINKEKILLGYSLIHNEGMSVKEAAYLTGFHDPFYFSRVFKKILGISPETLRGRTYIH